MKKPVVLIGVGEVGGVFARGFLKNGHPVFPVTREMNLATADVDYPEPEAVIVGVGEKGLDDVLKEIPQNWRDRLVLLQNELLPRNWESHQIDPTVISVWFEKKPGQDVKVIIPSPVYGQHAQLVADALSKVNVSTKVLGSKDALVFELVLKNLYILTTNISGLEVGGNVGELWNNHQDVARAVSKDVLEIQYKLAGKEFDSEQLLQAMVHAFEGDLEHKCMGRSAPARLERAISQADELGLSVEKLREIQNNQSE